MRRLAGGHAFIEFAISATLIIPVVMLFIDSFLILSAMQINDLACAEAARLASTGDPRLVEARAYQIISQTVAPGQGTYSLRLLTATTTVQESQMQALLPFGGPISGTVSVSTEIEVNPFILGWFVGGQMPIHFRAQQIVPTTYVMPSGRQTLLQTRTPQ